MLEKATLLENTTSPFRFSLCHLSEKGTSQFPMAVNLSASGKATSCVRCHTRALRENANCFVRILRRLPFSHHFVTVCTNNDLSLPQARHDHYFRLSCSEFRMSAFLFKICLRIFIFLVALSPLNYSFPDTIRLLARFFLLPLLKFKTTFSSLFLSKKMTKPRIQ